MGSLICKHKCWLQHKQVKRKIHYSDSILFQTVFECYTRGGLHKLRCTYATTTGQECTD